MFCALFACAPLLTLRLGEGHDWVWEVVRVAEYHQAVLDGQWPPFFASNVFGGYGSAIFLFYPPLFSALAAGLAFTGLSIVQASALALLLLSLVGATGTYGAARAAGASAAGARIAVYTYTLHPYLIGDWLARNAHAEFAGLAFLPWVVWGVLALRRDRDRARLLLAGGLALTVVAHNLTGLVALGFVAVGVPLVLRREDRTWRVAATPIAGVVLALVLSAFYWVPALLEQDLMRSVNLTGGRYDFRAHFPTLGDVFGYREFYSTGPATPVLLAAIAGVLALRRSPLLATLFFGALSCFALVFSFTAALWDTLPVLPLYTFPWRFIGPAALLTALAASVAWTLASERVGPEGRIALETAIVVLCLLGAGARLSDTAPLSDATVEMLPRQLAPAAMRRHPVRIGFVDEYVPRAADSGLALRDPGGRGAIARRTPGASISGVVERGSAIAFDASSPHEAHVELRRYAAPLWHAHRAGAPLATVHSRGGRPVVVVPPGNGRVEVRARPPASRRWGLAASGLGLAAFTILAWRTRATLRARA